MTPMFVVFIHTLPARVILPKPEMSGRSLGRRPPAPRGPALRVVSAAKGQGSDLAAAASAPAGASRQSASAMAKRREGAGERSRDRDRDIQPPGTRRPCQIGTAGALRGTGVVPARRGATTLGPRRSTMIARLLP